MRRSFLVLPWVVACGASVAPPKPRPPEPIPIAAASADAEHRGDDPHLGDLCKIDPTACPKLDPPAPDGKPPKASVVDKLDPPEESYDVEARVNVEVKDIEKARAMLIELTQKANGVLVNEVVANGHEGRGGSLSLRVPSAGVRAFVQAINQIGRVYSSSFETNDLSQVISDREALVRSLEQTLHRYEELAAKAQGSGDTVRIEADLARVRTDLERARGDLAWSKESVGRAAVYVTLALEPEHAPIEKMAKLYPGLRATYLYDVVPATAGVPSSGFAGGGLSIAWPRTFSIDLDLMTSLKNPSGDVIDFYIVTLGTDIYSDFFGNGTRRFLNPYVGFRTGFAHAPGQPLFPIGGTVGLDLYKTSGALLAIEARGYALIGRKDAVDFGLEPALTLNVGY